MEAGVDGSMVGEIGIDCKDGFNIGEAGMEGAVQRL